MRNWLQSDGWTIVPAAQAQVGDVAIIGPFSAPCWAGMVVVPGSNPTLATHSGEYWLAASQLYCYYNGQQTYEKTYLQARFRVYLPLALRNYPPPAPKAWSGMHMGNRNTGDWSNDMLAPFDPGAGGAWPRIVVVQSRQVFNVNRNASPDCRISGVSVKNSNLFNYLRRAAQQGTWVVFRITPSPGNFVESIDPNWPNPQTRPAGRTLITQPGVRPGGWLQCDNDWRFRPVDDVGDEMLAIQRYILWQAPLGYEWQAFGFEPANEPNVEWYSFSTTPRLDEVSSWQNMDQYFANLYDYIHNNAGYLPIRVLTPPMAQIAYAETLDMRSCVPFNFSGYGQMPLTFSSANPKNDGYSWHNYWIQGREAWAECPNGQHVSMWFPDTMRNNVQNNVRPGVITEADLASPGQGMGNPVADKDAQPGVTAASLRDFLRNEQAHMADAIAVWLLNDDTGTAEHEWHQAYVPAAGFRQWFGTWWFGSEQ